jgi:hypothetical protein
MSRPKKVYTAEELAQVEALAAHGHTQDEISKFLGIKIRSFQYALSENEILNAFYEKGRFKARNFVVSRLMRYIKSDELNATNLKAIQFYLDNNKLGKNEIINDKPKLALSNKNPLELIDSTLEALEKREISIQEAQQIASLATTKMNIKNNLSIADITAQEKQSDEDLMAKVFAINRALDYQEKLNKEKNV